MTDNKSSISQYYRWVSNIIVLFFFCIQLPVYGLNPDGFEQGMHVGHVFARAVVKDDNGHPL
ncbi:hypothetical protein, partial [Zooshikella harenae]